MIVRVSNAVRRRMTLAAAATLLTAGIAAAQVPHQHHPPASAKEYARVLEDPSRDEWQKPHEVITELNLQDNQTVADLGAGTGYFSRRFARHAGQVLAVDIDPKLLEIAAKSGVDNLKTVLATPDDPKLAANSVDLIFICDVLHHIENRAAYYPKLAAALKPGGKIVIVDFFKKPLPVGPPPEMKLDEAQVIDELDKAGFKKTRQVTALPYQYFLFFERK